ncbi:MAG TPA: hypothetical protein PK629_10945 [Oscillospiraceae bacterium]|nr:hypothetical protein [Oscillospiraceae bacterium]HPF55026.1 hypothetical protein [Clostridiales bacterium]HPK35804.1 hypothetical protein [Oscillospiraceae bacterium]HPR75424.1 hypothetical protein [Oscillospiraceae bacterium]
MDKGKIADILEKVAVLNGVSVDEVRREIGLAIMEGMANPNPEIKASWTEMEVNQTLLSPEDVIGQLVQRTEEEFIRRCG